MLNPVKVPSVQELAEKNLAFLPPRYNRSGQLPMRLTSNATSLKEPVIDMQLLLSEDDVLVNSELRKLDLACKEWGVFQLINHGVSTSELDKWKLQIQDLFDLPLEVKNKLQLEGSQGFGQVNIESEEQKLDWGDAFTVVTLPIHLRKTQLFSQFPAPFRKSLEVYSTEMKNLAMKILSQMAKALGIKSTDDVTVLFDDGTQTMRMNYYPPCPQPELAAGISHHSDCFGITILLQANDVEGLEVEKDGTWVPVAPLPNAFVIIIGDILEIMTNGIYKSVLHRATVNKEKLRLSIGTFLSPSGPADIGPLPSLISPESPARFKRKSIEDHFRGCFPSGEKTYLDSIRI